MLSIELLSNKSTTFVSALHQFDWKEASAQLEACRDTWNFL